MLKLFSAVTLAMALVVPATASAAPLPGPPGKITIDVVSVNGSGCPAGTAAVAVNNDNTAFTVSYSNYLAQVGGDASPVDFRKNCQLGLNLHIPQGWTYAISQSDYRGFADLKQGAYAIERANYYFQGNSQNTPIEHRINGALSDNWQQTDRVDISALVYKPCGVDRILNVNSELRVYKGTSSAASFITMDSTDGDMNTIYHFSWKQC
ncbi:DUF4360 domain-containing protein [Pseudonocardiaceae bacterium YIM PH 21723]|nr:DUF4360 domain-containing protein [Pseudonocardiaceae bacterium YIM PH 21723]